MPKIANDLDAFLTQHQSRIEGELFDFLRIPSVSAQPVHDADTLAAAEWVKRSLEQAGVAAAPTLQRRSCTVITTFSRRNRWISGRLRHLSQKSGTGASTRAAL